MTEPPSRETRASDAARLAGGSGIVFAAGMVDRALRLFLTWLLSTLLLGHDFGLYVTAVTVVSLVCAFAPLGVDSGIVYFGARYSKSGDQPRLKGAIQLGFLLSVGSGLAGAVIIGMLPTLLPGSFAEDGVAQATRLVAPVVALWTPLLFFVGALRAVQDMRSSALAYQLTLPVAMVVFNGLALALGLGLEGVLTGFVAAHGVALLVGLRGMARHYLGLLRDRTVVALREPGQLLAYSFPQSLTAGAFRMNQWMDVLMLAWLATSLDVAHYKVAVSLAVLGAVPVNAITSMFNPMISELVETKELVRLDSLLKTVTRWLVIVTAPFYLFVGLLPDVVLAAFRPEYAANSLGPLLILVLGQAVSVTCAPTMRLIPMSGHAMLNLLNGLVAAALNFGLNYLLIPRYGSMGAAIATASTLALWSLWRLGEVWWLMRCFPLSRRTLGLVAFATIGGIGLYSLHLPLVGRLPATALLIAAFYGVVWRWGRTPADAMVSDRLKKRVNRLLSRG